MRVYFLALLMYTLPLSCERLYTESDKCADFIFVIICQFSTNFHHSFTVVNRKDLCTNLSKIARGP